MSVGGLRAQERSEAGEMPPIVLRGGWVGGGGGGGG